MTFTMPTSSTRLNYKDLRKPDSFLAWLRNFFKEFFEHARGLAIGTIVFLVVGVGFGLYANHQKSQKEEAANAYFEASTLLTETLDKASEGKKEDAPLLSIDELKAPIEALNLVATKFPKTQGGFGAGMTLGGLYFDRGQYEMAFQIFEAHAEKAPGRLEEALAYSAAGAALENLSKWDEARKIYEKGFNLGEATMKGEFLMSIARVSEQMGDKTKANEAYGRIVTDLPNTEYALAAERYRAMLE